MTHGAGVLVDTSVWIHHFRHGHPALAELLAQDRVLMHPCVLLELACVAPPAPRARTLDDLGRLAKARTATTEEVLGLIERERLYGQGCGMVDIALLASARITPGASLWTLDRRLLPLAQRLTVAWQGASGTHAVPGP